MLIDREDDLANFFVNANRKRSAESIDHGPLAQYMMCKKFCMIAAVGT